jgi:hypothetical protein
VLATFPVQFGLYLSLVSPGHTHTHTERDSPGVLRTSPKLIIFGKPGKVGVSRSPSET